MKTRIVALLVLGVLALTLVGCAATAEPVPDQSVTPPSGEPMTGTRLAPGLYDLDDGTVQAVGTLEYRDLEGGFWAVIGGTEADGNVGAVVAVVNNPADFEAQLKALDGKTVLVSGTRFDGASIRMAGPEIVVSAIEEISDTGGAAE